ncbi:MAG: methionine-R-sulfoxide reductase [Candidatus Bathyarchaeia archaeon]
MINPQSKNKELTSEEKSVIEDKATEAPFTGKYYAFWEKGTYICRRCGASLYRSENKFEADCGWPSFDQEISGAVKRFPDPDGRRVEIQCANCGAHLGHVFTGEHFTEKNTRHCVNSISMEFVPDKK